MIISYSLSHEIGSCWTTIFEPPIKMKRASMGVAADCSILSIWYTSVMILPSTKSYREHWLACHFHPQHPCNLWSLQQVWFCLVLLFSRCFDQRCITIHLCSAFFLVDVSRESSLEYLIALFKYFAPVDVGWSFDENGMSWSVWSVWSADCMDTWYDGLVDGLAGNWMRRNQRLYVWCTDVRFCRQLVRSLGQLYFWCNWWNHS